VTGPDLSSAPVDSLCIVWKSACCSYCCRFYFSWGCHGRYTLPFMLVLSKEDDAARDYAAHVAPPEMLRLDAMRTV